MGVSLGSYRASLVAAQCSRERRTMRRLGEFPDCALGYITGMGTVGN